MLNFVIQVLDTFLSEGMFLQFLLPIIALSFVAVVPCVVRYFFRR